MRSVLYAHDVPWAEVWKQHGAFFLPRGSDKFCGRGIPMSHAIHAQLGSLRHAEEFAGRVGKWDADRKWVNAYSFFLCANSW
jgi:hypothetical protein